MNDIEKEYKKLSNAEIEFAELIAKFEKAVEMLKSLNFNPKDLTTIIEYKKLEIPNQPQDDLYLNYLLNTIRYAYTIGYINGITKKD